MQQPKLQLIREWKALSLQAEFVPAIFSIAITWYLQSRLIDNLSLALWRATRKSHSIYLCGSRFDESLCRSLSRSGSFLRDGDLRSFNGTFLTYLIISRRSLSRVIRLKLRFLERDHAWICIRPDAIMPTRVAFESPSIRIQRKILAFDNEDEIFMQISSFKWSSSTIRLIMIHEGSESQSHGDNCFGDRKERDHRTSAVDKNHRLRLWFVAFKRMKLILWIIRSLVSSSSLMQNFNAWNGSLNWVAAVLERHENLNLFRSSL